MQRGGKREGAGRKKGFAALQAEEARRILADMVMKEIVPIGVALIAKAKKGDVFAIRELFDRAFGKPLVTIDRETVVYRGDETMTEEDINGQ